jgi:hypothetical protein
VIYRKAMMRKDMLAQLAEIIAFNMEKLFASYAFQVKMLAAIMLFSYILIACACFAVDSIFTDDSLVSQLIKVPVNRCNSYRRSLLLKMMSKKTCCNMLGAVLSEDAEDMLLLLGIVI